MLKYSIDKYTNYKVQGAYDFDHCVNLANGSIFRINKIVGELRLVCGFIGNDMIIK